MRQLFAGAAALLAAGCVATMASATTVVVTDPNPQGWSNPPGENISGGGGGSSAITSASARSGNGSIELHGDRTRWVLGSLYSSASNLGLFSDFTDLAFEYRIDPASVSGCCDPKYSPALRLVVWDGAAKKDFVFEQAYQVGGYGAAGAIGSWNATSNASTFYENSGSPLTQKTLATWSSGLSANAYVGAVYIGVGSGIGPNYLAYADNVTFNGDTYNFETAAVPEPSTWAMMILGFGVAGSAIRSRRRLAVAKA